MMAMRTWHTDPTFAATPKDTDPPDFTPGPGTELRHALPWFDDREQIEQINQWGVRGSLVNFDVITGWLRKKSAAEFGQPLAKQTATALVQTAIKQFQKKFPEGPPDDDHDGD